LLVAVVASSSSLFIYFSPAFNLFVAAICLSVAYFCLGLGFMVGGHRGFEFHFFIEQIITFVL
jgi:hypothetical protein